MKSLGFLWIILGLTLHAAEPRVLLEETFREDLGQDWFWGLGTWTARDGILHGFESGSRRHGPVKMRRLRFSDALIECEFRLVGKAGFAGLIFNGPQERGHLFHLVMARDHLRILVHPRKGESVELVRLPVSLDPGRWHRMSLRFQGSAASARVDHQEIHAEHPCIGEEKSSFGLGGESGGPEGEKAGALEFRRLRFVQDA